MAVKANEKVCWEVTCDHCGEGDNTEYDGSFHYDSESEAVQAVKGADWHVEDGFVICESCIEDEEGDAPIETIKAKIREARGDG